MAKALAACPVVADVVRRPPGTELLTARRQLPDEIGQAPVAGVAAGLGAQVRDQVLRRALPIDIELARRGIQEREQGAVGRLLAALERRRVQRAAERVGGQVVDAAVAHDRRRGHGLKDPEHHRPQALLDDSAALGRDRTRGVSEVEQVRALGIIELQSAGERLEHAVGHAAGVAALQALVVLDADPGQRGDLLAAQPVASTDINIPPPKRPRGALSIPPSQGLPDSPDRCQGERVIKPRATVERGPCALRSSTVPATSLPATGRTRRSVNPRTRPSASCSPASAGRICCTTAVRHLSSADTWRSSSISSSR